MGKMISISSNNAVNMNDLNGYKKVTIQCGGDVGNYIDANIYIDEQLVLTISDKLEHEIPLNNNSNLRINCVTKNNPGLVGIDFRIKAE